MSFRYDPVDTPMTGDSADHISGELDPRAVARATENQVWLVGLDDDVIGPFDVRAYTYARRVYFSDPAPAPEDYQNFTILQRLEFHLEELDEIAEWAEGEGRLAITHKLEAARGPLSSAIAAEQQYNDGTLTEHRPD